MFCAPAPVRAGQRPAADASRSFRATGSRVPSYAYLLFDSLQREGATCKEIHVVHGVLAMADCIAATPYRDLPWAIEPAGFGCRQHAGPLLAFGAEVLLTQSRRVAPCRRDENLRPGDQRRNYQEFRQEDPLAA